MGNNKLSVDIEVSRIDSFQPVYKVFIRKRYFDIEKSKPIFRYPLDTLSIPNEYSFEYR